MFPVFTLAVPVKTVLQFEKKKQRDGTAVLLVQSWYEEWPLTTYLATVPVVGSMLVTIFSPYWTIVVIAVAGVLFATFSGLNLVQRQFFRVNREKAEAIIEEEMPEHVKEDFRNGIRKGQAWARETVSVIKKVGYHPLLGLEAGAQTARSMLATKCPFELPQIYIFDPPPPKSRKTHTVILEIPRSVLDAARREAAAQGKARGQGGNDEEIAATLLQTKFNLEGTLSTEELSNGSIRLAGPSSDDSQSPQTDGAAIVDVIEGEDEDVQEHVSESGAHDADSDPLAKAQDDAAEHQARQESYLASARRAAASVFSGARHAVGRDGNKSKSSKKPSGDAQTENGTSSTTEDLTEAYKSAANRAASTTQQVADKGKDKVEQGAAATKQAVEQEHPDNDSYLASAQRAATSVLAGIEDAAKQDSWHGSATRAAQNAKNGLLGSLVGSSSKQGSSSSGPEQDNTEAYKAAAGRAAKVIQDSFATVEESGEDVAEAYRQSAQRAADKLKAVAQDDSEDNSSAYKAAAAKASKVIQEGFTLAEEGGEDLSEAYKKVAQRVAQQIQSNDNTQSYKGAAERAAEKIRQSLSSVDTSAVSSGEDLAEVYKAAAQCAADGIKASQDNGESYKAAAQRAADKIKESMASVDASSATGTGEDLAEAYRAAAKRAADKIKLSDDAESYQAAAQRAADGLKDSLPSSADLPGADTSSEHLSEAYKGAAQRAADGMKSSDDNSESYKAAAQKAADGIKSSVASVDPSGATGNGEDLTESYKGAAQRAAEQMKSKVEDAPEEDQAKPISTSQGEGEAKPKKKKKKSSSKNGKSVTTNEVVRSSSSLEATAHPDKSTLQKKAESTAIKVPPPPEVEAAEPGGEDLFSRVKADPGALEAAQEAAEKAKKSVENVGSEQVEKPKKKKKKSGSRKTTSA